jgi:hypothetical protein
MHRMKKSVQLFHAGTKPIKMHWKQKGHLNVVGVSLMMLALSQVFNKLLLF